MNERELRALLEALHAGTATIDTTIHALAAQGRANSSRPDFVGSENNSERERDLGFAVVDTARASRQGQPEVVFGEGKTAAQIVAIAEVLRERSQTVLITRVDAEKAASICAALPTLVYKETARILVERAENAPKIAGNIGILAAGTSDMPVAEECAETLAAFGIEHERIYDVGVAGLHRLLARVENIRTKDALVVVAGMEGALPSVVGGLVDVPIIAVPTSVGYGAAFGGVAALFGMLTSCASGITVANIDNGFGAAFAAARLLRAIARGTEDR